MGLLERVQDVHVFCKFKFISEDTGNIVWILVFRVETAICGKYYMLEQPSVSFKAVPLSKLK